MPEEPGISQFLAFLPEQDAVQKANRDMGNLGKHGVFGHMKMAKVELRASDELRLLRRGVPLPKMPIFIVFGWAEGP
jgi:hypothetical protein